MRVAEGMKLVGEEVLFEARKVHVELYDRFWIAPDKIVLLENQQSLLEADY